MTDEPTPRRPRLLRVRADASLADRIRQSERGSTIWIETREAVAVHQGVRIEFGLGPLADEILVDAVVREVRNSDDPVEPPSVLLEVAATHENRFAYVHDVIRGVREVVTRRYRRVVARFPVVWTQGGHAHRSFTGDIAAGGTFVVSEESPEPGSSVEIELWIDAEDALEVTGLVTWAGSSRGEPGFGVQFRKLDAAVFNRLRELVREREAAQTGS